MPNPLNNGKSITDGTFPARLVITKLIIERASALPVAQRKILFLPISILCFGRIKKHIIKKAMRKEIVRRYALFGKVNVHYFLHYHNSATR